MMNNGPNAVICIPNYKRLDGLHIESIQKHGTANGNVASQRRAKPSLRQIPPHGQTDQTGCIGARRLDL
jgi:hypothetical protein